MEKRLGKGLEALIPEAPSKTKEKVESLKVSDIIPNRFQPRKEFETEKMEDLINSIKEKGVIQPVLVRVKDDVYELIAGERRLRAVKELQLGEIPAIIKKDINDVSSLEISLIENVQREELNPVEEAHAYRELMDRFEHTLDRVGQMVGKDKTTISNSVRLLNLPEEILDYLKQGTISTGHAKVLLSIQDGYRQKKMAETILKHGLSVRQAEQLVKMARGAKKKREEQKDPELKSIEEELQHLLGTKVNIRHGKKRGRIEIQYFSNEDLQRLLKIIMQGEELAAE